MSGKEIKGNEMWNGKRLGVEGALTMKYDRVFSKNILKDQHNLTNLTMY